MANYLNPNLKFLLILLPIILVGANSSGQSNTLTRDENKSLKINDVYFYKLEKTKGNVALLAEFFGEPIKVKEEQGGIAENWRILYFNDITIGYNNVDLDDYEAYIYYIKAKSISLKGNTVSIGDPVTNLGSDIVYNTGTDLTKSVVIDWGSCCTFIIEFNQVSGLVTEISYHVWT